MPIKHIHLQDIGDTVLSKRKGTKNIRLTITHDGKLRVGMPHWMPYSAAEIYISTKRQWIIENLKGKAVHEIIDGSMIGKAHRVSFLKHDSDKISTKVTHTKIIIKVPTYLQFHDEQVQKKAQAACVKALRQESEHLLPIRLQSLATKNNFVFTSVKIKMLKTRWGSCDTNKNICFNLYLIQMPWEIIDYVIMHELQHTKMMHHKQEFWKELAVYVPDLAAKKRELKSKQPILQFKT